ncbi:complex I subunit 5 family protein [Oscillibacter hominis]|uniref:complex I subunit 5 family protein n=1 Tax=Oscillibacter hominis TaxID=2763056 RepID=UPI001FAB414B|nr:proton-conducting transporter membrane subunit [Oscillibacter hominis]
MKPLLLAPLLIPFAGGCFVFLEKREKQRNNAVLCTVWLTALSAVLVCLLPVEPMELLTIEGHLTLALTVDRLGRFFLLFVSGIWIAVTYFAFPYIRHVGKEQQFFGFFTMALGALMGLCLARNFITFYMFFELMTLLTVPLVLHTADAGARGASLKYLGFSVFGAGIALAGFFFLAPYLISYDFTAGGALNTVRAAEHRQLLLTVYFMMVIGFGCKAGLLPMQAWLTTAHPVAPAPASALLSGVITKAGVLGILRVTFYLYGDHFLRGTWAQEVLLILALTTIFTGSMLAYKEKVLKKRLAYSTVSQISYALFGIFLLTEQGMEGALLQIVFHAIAKDALFLAAGAILYMTSATRVDQLEGIGKKMPATMWCFTIASLSLIGIPPMSGFVSKWYLALGAMDSNFRGIALVGIVVLLVSALLTAGYLLPIITRGFFPGKEVIVEHKEAGRLMTVPMMVLSALTIVLGLAPGLVSQQLEGLIHLLFWS